MEFSDQKSYIRGSELKSPGRFYRTVPEMIRKHSKDESKVVQIYIDWQTFEEETLTYKDMYESGKAFAEGLVELGLNKGDIVAVGTENTPTWVWVMVGVQLCGAIPLHFRFNLKDGSDVEALLKSAGNKCKAVIFPSGSNDSVIETVENIFGLGNKKGQITSATLPSVKWSILLSNNKESTNHYNITDILEKRKAGTTVLPILDPDDIVAIVLTSGSTGTPKLVPISHNAMLILGYHVALSLGEQTDICFNDRPFNWMSGYPCWEFFTGQTRMAIKNVSAIPNATMYYDVISRILRKEQVNAAFLATAILQDVYNIGKFDWKVRSITTSGEPVPATLASLIGKICDQFTNEYGSTEIGSVALKNTHTSEDFMDYEAGFPSPGVEIKIVDENGALLERGIEGEVWVRAVTPFLGYWNDEEKTKEVLTNSGWYKMGDLAKITQNGSLIIHGRLDDTRVKVNGIFISVFAVEGHLKRHPDVMDAVVFPIMDDEGLYKVCCAINVNDGCELNKEMMDTFILDQKHSTEIGILQHLRLPRLFVFLDTFPRTSRDKVDRKKIADICKDMLNIQNK